MPAVDWEVYARHRNLARNRLLLAWHAELVDAFLSFFGRIPNDRRVLDIGPANGFFMGLLRDLGYRRVDGLEISPGFLEELRARNLDAYPGDILTGEGCDRLSPPYDAVLLMEILEHLAEPQHALRRARDLLAKDGFLYLTVPMCDCVFDRFRRVVGRRTRLEQVKAIDETHLHAFSPERIEALLGQSGLKVKEMRRVSMRPPFAERYQPGKRRYLLLRALLPRALRGFFLTVVAEAAG